MHLLSAQNAQADDDQFIDLKQNVAQITFLSAQEAELCLLAKCHQQLGKTFPSICLSSLLYLKHPASLDYYYQNTLKHTQLIVAILLGGQSYWAYLLERLKSHIQQHPKTPVIIINGEKQFDPLLSAQGNIPLNIQQTIHRYLQNGGHANYQHCLQYLTNQFFGHTYTLKPPQTLPNVIFYLQQQFCQIEDIPFQINKQQANVLLLFYKNYLQTDLAQFIDQWPKKNINLLPIAIDSLKNKKTLAALTNIIQHQPINAIINTTGFASHQNWSSVPIIQAILSNISQSSWQTNSLGLSSMDITMQVTLPEMDGRIISTACIFKERQTQKKTTQHYPVQYLLHVEHAQHINTLALAYYQLQKLSNQQKKIAIILNNYPSQDSRLGNAVGLDVPQSLIYLLQSLKNSGYKIKPFFNDPQLLMQYLKFGITNHCHTLSQKHTFQSLGLEDYQQQFIQLPTAIQTKIHTQWGAPEQDPLFKNNCLGISGLRLSHVFVGIQPSRGYQLNNKDSYHSPTLVPPHHYLAFYLWLRDNFSTHAIIHFGKHGNLEWLPGKSCALSNQCFPFLLCPNIPHFYPFIINDPGEGTQAKRRTQAVIIDHLMPPISRSDTYEELQTIETLIDEYYQANYTDPKRTNLLKEKIIKLSQSTQLQQEIDPTQDPISEIDNYLCEIKETIIRSGLHILGHLPKNEKLIETLFCLSIVPRGLEPQQQSLNQMLALDLLDEKDLHKQASNKVWQGQKPKVLQNINNNTWRTYGDTQERINQYAHQLIKKTLTQHKTPTSLKHTQLVLEAIGKQLLPKLQQSAKQEIQSLLNALDGQFIPPGPSGAPSRGRWDILPTGKNFYSIDHRYLPTPSAYELGVESANLLLERYLQDHGEYPQSIGLSIWATSTMRTGGDDIAQAMALLGVRPVWCTQTGRVTHLQILPSHLLNRPRINVILRISGMFRDAFMHLVEMLEGVIKNLSKLNEPQNPIYQQSQQIKQHLSTCGLDEKTATQYSQARIFGSKPGGYGAGLQALIENKNWENSTQLAQNYINWSQYAYGTNMVGIPLPETFTQQLKTLDIVMHNQDNREHDILDSDDYYQFQGGMICAAKSVGNTKVSGYFGDHSHPNNLKIHTLAHEIDRTMRARVLNPKWIEGMKQHGYKGAFEMLATVDYLFGFSATTGLVKGHHYSHIFSHWIQNSSTKAFLTQHNLDALIDILERLQEAITRNLWQASNTEKQQILDELNDAHNQLEQ